MELHYTATEPTASPGSTSPNATALRGRGRDGQASRDRGRRPEPGPATGGMARPGPTSIRSCGGTSRRGAGRGGGPPICQPACRSPGCGLSGQTVAQGRSQVVNPTSTTMYPLRARYGTRTPTWMRSKRWRTRQRELSVDASWDDVRIVDQLRRQVVGRAVLKCHWAQESPYRRRAHRCVK
jgi:hypothetical protein